ncbi:MAG: FAD:protein FMN transferase [Thermoguttaceae bacterium]|nr:FAD:protein FMN transferase [Thermoguttaceae bacterium]
MVEHVRYCLRKYWHRGDKYRVPARGLVNLLLTLTISALSGAGLPAQEATSLERFEFTGEAMAAPVKLILYATDRRLAEAAAQMVFDRLQALNAIFSDYDPQSELSALCRRAPTREPVPVSAELWEVLSQAQYFAELTGGAFDITVGPVVRLWRRARRQRELPDPRRLSDALSRVGYQKLKLFPEHQAVALLEPGIQLDLGGIAKGYAGDEALALLRQMGITRALVDIGGDISLGDPPPQLPGWRVAIEPLRPEDPPPQVVLLSRCAIATSGDTQRYVIINGIRYSHIVDPRTGQAMTGNMSVTVVAPRGTTADAMASAIRVLGPEKGLPLINRLPGAAACVLFLPDGASPERKPEMWQSDNWAKLPRLELPFPSQ